MPQSDRTSRAAALATIFAATALSFAFVLMRPARPDATNAQLFWFSTARSAQPLPTCRDAGRCGEKEKSLILPKASKDTVSTALQKGCKVRRSLRDSTVLRCPSNVSLSSAFEERALRITDVYANRQTSAEFVQTDGWTGKGIRVAILDTGADGNHPELAGKIVASKNFTDDANQDGAGHGTHVSGIVAGAGIHEFEAGTGFNRALGVAPDAELIVGKVCDNQGWCLEGDVKAGIEWAASQRARIINLSLGGGAFLSDCDNDSMAADVNWAVAQGIAVVVAAGNGGITGEGIATPGCASKAITVGAVDASGNHADWSSFGRSIDVSAPGVGILSSVSCLSVGNCPTPNYGWWSGTSMATPHVTGIVALLLEKRPTLTPQDLYSLLTNTAIDRGEDGFDKKYGYGIVNARNAMDGMPDEQNGSASSDHSSASSSVSDGSRSSREQAESSSSSNQRPPQPWPLPIPGANNQTHQPWGANPDPGGINPSLERRWIPDVLKFFVPELGEPDMQERRPDQKTKGAKAF